MIKVSGFVENFEEKVLLVNAAGRGWELPGGRLEADETVVEALAREILEESSCSVAVNGLVGIYSQVQPRPALIHLFRCRHLSGVPRPTDPKVVDARWFSLEEARTVIQQAEVCDRLEDALGQRWEP